MWKRVGLFLAVSGMALGAGPAEARFGKSSGGSSSGHSSPGRSSSGHSAAPVGSGYSRPSGRSPGRTYISPSYGYGAPYGYYPGASWGGYYDPAWAWPFLGAPTPYYSNYYGSYYGRGYELDWRRRQRAYVEDTYNPSPVQMDLSAEAGVVSEGYAVGLGLRMEGEKFGFGAKLDMFDLATDDGSAGRDSLSLLSLQPSVALVANDRLRWRVSGGVNMAFAPSAIMVAPGVGTSARLRLIGPLKAEASAQYAPWPFTQLGGEAGLAVDVGVVRLRGGYRATYLNDQGRVDESGRANSDLLAGPFAGLSLVL